MALLDFDVHHGNGTQACAAGAAPGVARYAFKTPTSEGVQTFPVFRPWLDFDDADNILFARRARAPRRRRLRMALSSVAAFLLAAVVPAS